MGPHPSTQKQLPSRTSIYDTRRCSYPPTWNPTTLPIADCDNDQLGLLPFKLDQSQDSKGLGLGSAPEGFPSAS